MADYGTLLRDRVTLKCGSIDRIFLQAYVPKLQTVGQVCTFLRWRRKFKIPSSAAFGKLGDEWVKRVHEFAKRNEIPVVHFKKGQNKEELARPYMEAAAQEGKDRVVLIGIAQEKASAWRSWKAKGQEKAAHPHMEWGRQMVFVNHFYFYLWDSECGPAFWKTNSYAPYPIWVYLNGHEWAKQQLKKAGIKYEALDNGFRSCADPERLQRICERFGAGVVQSFFWRWLQRIPSPFSNADLRAGYIYKLAFRQFEVSDTRVFDRPQAGRQWFESVIREHLDIGRPDQISLIFGRGINSRTKGVFRTQVISKGVDPTLTGYYKSSRIKQYFKEGRALRTETVICNSRDFGIGRRVTAKNWNALRAVGELANQRLCDAEASDAMPAPDVVTFSQVTQPSVHDGLPAPGLRFGDPRVMALLAGLVKFSYLVEGFTNSQIVQHTAQLLNQTYTSRQATYDLRRLKRKGLISRPGPKRRYQLTALGRRIAVLFTKTYVRVLTPGLTAFDPGLPNDVAHRSRLATAWRGLEAALSQFMQGALAAA